MEAAGRLARAAANEAATAAAEEQASSSGGSGGGPQVLVAGSLPPLRESYQASGLQAFEEMQPQYHLLAGLLKPHCDLLLCETLATVTEGLAAASAASASGLPFWVSWTKEDSTERSLLRSGEALQASRRAAAPGCHREALALLLRWRLASPHAEQYTAAACGIPNGPAPPACRRRWQQWRSCPAWRRCWSTAAARRR